jgi:inner membrane protein
MPSAFSHPAAALAVGLGLGASRVPHRLLAAGLVASVVPDLDVLALYVVPYEHPFGHRGASHSLAFACLMGLLALLCAPALHTSRGRAFAFVTLSGASHGLLDMLTNGGGGVALLWPLTNDRISFPYRVIQVSPLGIKRFFGPQGSRS